jgi:hypothetical protein
MTMQVAADARSGRPFLTLAYLPRQRPIFASSGLPRVHALICADPAFGTLLRSEHCFPYLIPKWGDAPPDPAGDGIELVIKCLLLEKPHLRVDSIQCIRRNAPVAGLVPNF